MSNSIKYKSKTKPPKIRITVTKNNNMTEITVADNGVGINLDEHGKYIFGLYKRFNLDVEGKGLGLHMTKLQIEAMNGTIRVESKVNEGTTFTIKLP